MSKPKHTPGPWKVGDTHPLGAIGVHLSDGLLVAVARYSDNPRISGSEAEYNAALVAAAPDLLKFLKVLSDRMSHDPDPEYQTILDGALAAIAKAEGRAK